MSELTVCIVFRFVRFSGSMELVCAVKPTVSSLQPEVRRTLMEVLDDTPAEKFVGPPFLGKYDRPSCPYALGDDSAFPCKLCARCVLFECAHAHRDDAVIELPTTCVWPIRNMKTARNLVNVLEEEGLVSSVACTPSEEDVESCIHDCTVLAASRIARFT